MQPEFGVKRERQNHLFYQQYENDSGAFHFHSQIELYFVDDGEMEVVVGNQQRVLTKGQMSVAFSFDAHAYKTPVQSKSSVLIIPPHLCEEYVKVMRHKRIANPFITDEETVKRIRAYYDEILKGTPNEITLLGYLYVILGIVMEHVGSQVSESEVEPELSARLLWYMNDHYQKDVTLPSLATVFGYSQSYLSRYFKSCFHIGINHYLTMLRLKNAILLMREEKHSITYCALESGFNSLRTFYRCFHKEFGCSPKEYISLDNPFLL
ncbi:MAG: helix-turn-helix transcriptional regulator [Clostridia bacterium]|nr:helix-turn-helix transcriptional regulator [Clostridia bacterium]